MHINPYLNDSWSSGRKLFFYFSFLFIWLYILLYPIQAPVYMLQRLFSYIDELFKINFFETINGWINKADYFISNDIWQMLITKIGNFFNLNIKTFTNGSGDTTYDWLYTAFKVFVSIVGSFIWYFFAKRQTNHSKLYKYTVTFLRYYLASVLLSYGFVKVIQNQFPFPNLGRLTQTYGDSSPMGLAWTFMGYSKGYNLFTGGCEILGGLFLFFRRTKTFGALFSLTVCVNIFVMNLCFDIPVKLFSFHLLLFSLYIALDDLKRIFNFFFVNKPIEPYTMPSAFGGLVKYKKHLFVLKWVYIIYLLYTNFVNNKTRYYESGMGIPKPPLYGVYNANVKLVNGDTVALKYMDTTNFKQIIIARKGSAGFRLLNDSLKRYIFRVDTLTQHIEWFANNDSTVKNNYSYNLNNGVLELFGKTNNDSIYYKFIKYDDEKMLLKSRGFNWINETPFNR